MKRNKAFTIAELCFVMVFIGVISIIALHTMNDRFTDYAGRYFTAFESLSRAAYGIETDAYKGDNDELKSDPNLKSCFVNSDGEDISDFPTSTKCLCARLSQYLNNTYINCSNTNLIQNEDNGETFDQQFDDKKRTPGLRQMTLTNGFIVYLSDKGKIEYNHAGNASYPEELEYFIVYVDLNGISKPNRATHHPNFASNNIDGKPNERTIRPDIVPFIITRKGNVIPVGFPIYDTTYATARVVNALEEKYQTKSYTINEARCNAFNEFTGGNEITDSKTPYSDMPLTLIPEFEKKIPKCIKPNNSADATTITEAYMGPGEIKIPGQNWNCKAGTYNCYVKIDENIEKRF